MTFFKGASHDRSTHQRDKTEQVNRMKGMTVKVSSHWPRPASASTALAGLAGLSPSVAMPPILSER